MAADAELVIDCSACGGQHTVHLPGELPPPDPDDPVTAPSGPQRIGARASDSLRAAGIYSCQAARR